MKQTLCTSQYSKRIAHGPHPPVKTRMGDNQSEKVGYRLPSIGLTETIADVDTPLDASKDDMSRVIIDNPDVHTQHFYQEIARAIWRNYKQ